MEQNKAPKTETKFELLFKKCFTSLFSANAIISRLILFFQFNKLNVLFNKSFSSLLSENAIIIKDKSSFRERS
jgi:hypothetical protein